MKLIFILSVSAPSNFHPPCPSGIICPEKASHRPQAGKKAPGRGKIPARAD